MKRAKSIVSAVAVVLCAGAVPVAAQAVGGGSGSPDVQVNWSALDRLGPPPTLPGMLQGQAGTASASPAAPAQEGQPGPGGAVYKPYAPGGGAVYKPYAAPHPRQAAAVHALHKTPAEASPAPVQASAPVKAAAAPAGPPPKPEIAAPAAPASSQAASRPGLQVVATPPAASPVAASPVPAPVAAPTQLAASPPPAAAPAPAPASAQTAPAQTAPAPSPQAASAPVQAVQPEAPPVQAAPTQTASLPAAPAAGVIRKGDTLSVVFAGDGMDLPDGARAALTALASRMLADDSLGLQLLSYAKGDEGDFAKAHRLSLSRALAVRNVLKDLGVPSTRIDVRALGAKAENDGPADRVDAVLVSR
jgi:outer membrane protein OmpA-like peptidoglycan-associated protein